MHLDLFYFGKYTFLIIVDAFSRWIDVNLLKTSNANSIIDHLRRFIVTFGLPREIVSDNGPPFNSSQFIEFCQKQGIKVTKSPPYHPESNGLAERGVQTTKNALKRFLLDEKYRSLTINEQVDNFLFKYRNTPNAVSGISPSAIMFKFKPQTLIDKLSIKQKTDDKIESQRKIDVVKTKNFPVNNFEKGEKIMYLNHFKSFCKWIPGRIRDRISKTLYRIDVNDTIRIVHVSSLRRSKLSDKYHPNVAITIIPNKVEQKEFHVQKKKIKRKQSVRPRWSEFSKLRRSLRKRKPQGFYKC